MLILLLACAKPPSVTFPVTIPAAENGAAMPAITYVRPAVTTLDDTALCGEPDVRGYLADGSFGWRVLELRDAGPFGPTGEPLRDLAPRWRAADAHVTEVCGTHDRGAVLVVVERGRALQLMDMISIHRLLPDTDVHVLVSDPTPSALVPARPGTGDPWTLAVGARSWVLLPHADGDASEFFTRAEAISRLVQLNPEPVVLIVDKPTWDNVAAELDALAAHGIWPVFGLSVGQGPPPSFPTPVPGSTQIVLTDTLAVLPLNLDSSKVGLIQINGSHGGPPIREDTDQPQ